MTNVNQMDSWWIEGASLRGTTHKRNGTPNQDSFHYERAGDSFVLVVCDGAGCVGRSQFGSQATAKAAAGLLLHNASDVMGRRLDGRAVVDVVLDAIAEVACRRGEPIGEYACTLVAVLVHGGYLMTCHVGDGAIYMLVGNHPVCVSPPTNGRDGGTLFVTREGVVPRMWRRPMPDNATGLLVTSDGASKLHSSITHWVTPMVTRLVNALDFGSAKGSWLEQLCESELRPHTGDDITVLAARKPYVAGVYGCPRCGSLGVANRVNSMRTALVGKCRACKEIVFHYDAVEDAVPGFARRLAEAGALAIVNSAPELPRGSIVARRTKRATRIQRDTFLGA